MTSVSLLHITVTGYLNRRGVVRGRGMLGDPPLWLDWAATNTFFLPGGGPSSSKTRFCPADLGGAPQGWPVCDGCHSETNKSEIGKREEAQENANDASAEQWIEALRQQKMITNPNRSKEVDIRRKPKRQGIIPKRISNPRHTHIFDPMEISLLKRPSTLEKASIIGLTFIAKNQARKSKDPNVGGSNQDVWRFNKSRRPGPRRRFIA